ncbi:dolichyl-P-Man:Man(6)GlcNAc(2)-PP-dolichol alpha-1,2-mannosyltransferase KNAG_0F00920 [Huiozyma naganishii CBS 8797]|uniref:Mannosyltransferase n=1 Tax=Huiozyma naganishii (strain ATCC MYA-139 / BCRC 22969 / CBS 8797 / KCTC 17520 / NBRC 10181 / NCYC 3082 / Yp74L-3) TaxID=1071383 RepID=J7S884_HUIN7|nr:hypothetical protein KNAG_0F00920 [Kazachstania naganishii CBS 8797]CCK70761.1 hypothetical protein KNAG_0F00920 [Kazachstania naganishii CBS 8797]
MQKGHWISALLVVLLLTSRLYVQPLYSIISDCDETFNYWEPLNLLLRNFGKQTWEYSPEYSIRSWSLLLPFNLLLYPLQKLSVLQTDKYWNFYIVRTALGSFSALLEWKLFREIEGTLSLKIANTWLLFQIFTPGYFHASVELLPSAIAMILYLNTAKYTLRYLSTNSISSFVSSLAFNFIASVLGWPFVMVLSVPLCFHYLFTHRIISSLRTSFDCSLVFLLLGSVVIVIDSIFYGKFAPVSWNILTYNVLNADEKSGPNIFGVEPWYYYLLNLLLNFPLPVLFFSVIGLFHRRLWPLNTSLLLWICVFTAQPHKEERFLYPIYGLITLTASVGFYKFYSAFNFNKCIKRVLQFAVIALVLLQSISRTIALVTNYSAPFSVYKQISKLDSDGAEIVQVCTGREWYRFPNSFFLPDKHRLGFVKSGFDGLLPGDFSESGKLLDNIRALPKGMNNKNQFDEGKIIDIEQCDYFVDVSQNIDPEADVFSPNSDDWKSIYCQKFIDTDRSKILGRAFYIPVCLADIAQKYLGEQFVRVYGIEYLDYCLFQKITPEVEAEATNINL